MKTVDHGNTGYGKPGQQIQYSLKFLWDYISVKSFVIV